MEALEKKRNLAAILLAMIVALDIFQFRVMACKAKFTTCGHQDVQREHIAVACITAALMGIIGGYLLRGPRVTNRYRSPASD